MGATRFFHFTLLSTALLCLVSSHHHYHHYRHVYQFPPFHIQPPPLGHSYGTYDEPDIVPELVGGGPQSDIQVLYNVNGTLATVNFGNDLTPTEVKDKPITYWFGDPRSYYTLMMIDPDAPSRKDQKLSPILHYLVGNIPGHDVNKGHIIADYRGAMPPKGSGFHRYIFLLYQQIKKINFKEPHIPSSSVKGRLNFPVRNFTEQYQLFGPVASNYFRAQNEDNVVIQVGSGDTSESPEPGQPGEEQTGTEAAEIPAPKEAETPGTPEEPDAENIATDEPM